MLIMLLVTLILIYIGFKIIISKFYNYQLFDLDKKVIFITGSDSGIGNEAAKYFHKLGFVVFAGCLDVNSKGALDLSSLNDHKSTNEACISTRKLDESIRSTIESNCHKTSNNRIHTVQIDITNTASVRNAVNSLDEFLNRNKELSFHCLINNAGVCIVGEYDWFTLEHIQKIIDINLMGTLRTIKLFLSLIIKYKSRILIIGSVNAIYAYPGISVYCATKSALNLFSQSLRFELNKFGVKVLMLNPGDYSNKTNIMSNQAVYFQEMISNFSIETQNLYKGYIEKYIELTNQNIGVTGSKGSDKVLFDDLNQLLTKYDPPNEILSVPLINRIILKIYFSLPVKVQLFVFQQLWNRFFKIVN